METESVRPETARDVGEFVGMMRQLKELSGCTLRELEQRAIARGDVLPRSTTADVLRRPNLPRPEVLTAFVRACTGSEEQVTSWSAARARLAVSSSPATIPPPPAGLPPGSPSPGSPPPASPSAPWRRRVGIGAAVLVPVVLVAVGATVLLGREEPAAPPGGADASAPAGPRLAGGGSVVRIRPVGVPTFCLTEGRDSTGQYEHAVVVQRACAGAEPPQTILQLVGDGLHQMKWKHPTEGLGCLTLRDSGPGTGLVEPWTDCAAGGSRQLFRFEPAGASAYRMRSAANDACFGIKGDARASGAELARQQCTASDSQVFLVDVVAPA
ncbi:RICIN domain-containing protein [Micromonospora sp. NPDC002296]|uniref:RICIN domain-containing protein n=1 Tax=Micromonospora sp. NPDC002296 TaxID=3154271 RepID=UPI003319B3B5